MRNSKKVNEYITNRTAKGWIIRAQDNTGIQTAKSKQWSKLLLIGGLITIPLYGFGVILWIIAIILYLLSSEKVEYQTYADINAPDFKDSIMPVFTPMQRSGIVLLIVASLPVVILIGFIVVRFFD